MALEANYCRVQLDQPGPTGVDQLLCVRRTRLGKTGQLYSQLQTSGQLGMQTLERALADLVQAGSIDRAEAMAKAGKPEELGRLLGGSG